MTESGFHEIESRDHYAYVTRSAIRLFNERLLSSVTGIDVEPDYGYLTRLRYNDGSVRITYGNDLGLNSGAACDLAKDKGYTKFMLRTVGINTPAGAEFLLPWWAEQIAPSQQARGNTDVRTVKDAKGYVEDHLGYPVFVKPAQGSKGLGVNKVGDANEMDLVLETYDADRVKVAIIEETIEMPDYRVVVLDGEVISAYLRRPLAVRGDGVSSIEQLLAQTQEKYRLDGRDTVVSVEDSRIRTGLQNRGLEIGHVPEDGVELTLGDISNLSAGGTSEDVTETIHERWVKLSAHIAKNFNLRICGVDLACEDIEVEDSDYSVLEVNAAPGLDHYASTGIVQQRIVDNLYAKVLNAYPSRY